MALIYSEKRLPPPSFTNGISSQSFSPLFDFFITTPHFRPRLGVFGKSPGHFADGGAPMGKKAEPSKLVELSDLSITDTETAER
jgi:hypothetical protein